MKYLRGKNRTMKGKANTKKEKRHKSKRHKSKRHKSKRHKSKRFTNQKRKRYLAGAAENENMDFEDSNSDKLENLRQSIDVLRETIATKTVDLTQLYEDISKKLEENEDITKAQKEELSEISKSLLDNTKDIKDLKEMASLEETANGKLITGLSTEITMMTEQISKINKEVENLKSNLLLAVEGR